MTLHPWVICSPEVWKKDDFPIVDHVKVLESLSNCSLDLSLGVSKGALAPRSWWLEVILVMLCVMFWVMFCACLRKLMPFGDAAIESESVVSLHYIREPKRLSKITIIQVFSWHTQKIFEVLWLKSDYNIMLTTLDDKVHL